jgi:hypothetical protein
VDDGCRADRDASPAERDSPDFKIHSKEQRVNIIEPVNIRSTWWSIPSFGNEILHRERTRIHTRSTAMETGYAQRRRCHVRLFIDKR